MSRRPMMAGNWKMNKTTSESVVLSQAISFHYDRDWDDVDVVLCPPFIDIKSVSNVLGFDRSQIMVGGQDVFWEDSGAFTGEISPVMLKEAGCTHCIVGHSERRAFFCESDETVNRKVNALLAHGLMPIMCCGESLEVREAGDTVAFVSAQVREGLSGIAAKDLRNCVIAYEPVWAIGTGRAATPEQAEEVCQAIRATLAQMADQNTADAVRILYGGSMKPGNAEQFVLQPDIDGGLIGGSALDADDFSALVEVAYRSLRRS